MYYPLKYRSVDDLIGSIHDTMGIGINGSVYLLPSRGSATFATPPRLAQIWSRGVNPLDPAYPNTTSGDSDFAARNAAAGGGFTFAPIFEWDGEWVLQSAYANKAAYAQALITAGKAIIG